MIRQLFNNFSDVCNMFHVIIYILNRKYTLV